MLSHKLAQRVHVMPLGYEYERAIAALMSVHAADKVILILSMLTPDPAFAKRQETYTNKVKETLEQRGVAVSVVDTGEFSPLPYIRELAQIVKAEKDAGNEVYINTSSSGKLMAMASIMVGIAQESTLYYIYADQYSDDKEEQLEHGLSSCNIHEPRLLLMPKLRFVMPKDEETLLLECLYVAREHGREWIEAAETAAVLHAGFPTKYPWNPPQDMPRRRSYRQPFASSEERKAYEESAKQRNAFLAKFRTTFGKVLVEREQIECNHENFQYRITENGENMLYLKGLTGKVKFEDGKLVYMEKPGDGSARSPDHR